MYQLRMPILFALISLFVNTNGQQFNSTFDNISSTDIPVINTTQLQTTSTSSPLPDPDTRTWTLTGHWSQFMPSSGRFISFSVATDENCDMVRFAVSCPSGDYWCGFGIGGKYHFNSGSSEEHSGSSETASSAETDRRRRLSGHLARRILASSEDGNLTGNFSSTSHGEEEEGLEMNGYAIITDSDDGDMWESTLQPGATPQPQMSQDLQSCTQTVIEGHREVICYRKYSTGDSEDFKDFAYGKNDFIFGIGNVTSDGVLQEHAPGDENRHYEAMLLDGDEDEQCGFAGQELQDQKDKDKEDEAWFITGIVFICAFGLLLIAVIGYFVWLKFFHEHDHDYKPAGGHSHGHNDEHQNIVTHTDD